MRILHNNNPSKNKVTLIGCVHGDETFGYKVYRHFASNLDNFPGLTVILANEQAHQIRKRFVEADLNRSFPGDKHGSHEQRLASELKTLIDLNSFVIDIHTTRSAMTMVPIVTNLSVGTKVILNQTKARNIVFMKQTFGSLIGQYQAAVSFEYNSKYSRRRQRITELERMVRSLLNGKLQPRQVRSVFECGQKIPLDTKIVKGSTNFVSLSGTDIIPLFPRQRARNGSKGFSLKKPKNHSI
jgi:hypothetical protein